MDRLRKLAEIAMHMLDSIIDIYDRIDYVEFEGTKNNRKATCRVYNNGKTYLRWE